MVCQLGVSFTRFHFYSLPSCGVYLYLLVMCSCVCSAEIQKSVGSFRHGEMRGADCFLNEKNGWES